MPNPVNPKSKMEILNYSSRLCEFDKIITKNSLMRYLVGSFQKAANFTLSCTYSPVRDMYNNENLFLKTFISRKHFWLKIGA